MWRPGHGTVDQLFTIVRTPGLDENNRKKSFRTIRAVINVYYYNVRAPPAGESQSSCRNVCCH